MVKVIIMVRPSASSLILFIYSLPWQEPCKERTVQWSHQWQVLTYVTWAVYWLYTLSGKVIDQAKKVDRTIMAVSLCCLPSDHSSNSSPLLSEGNSKGKAVSHAPKDAFMSKHFCIWCESIYLSLPTQKLIESIMMVCFYLFFKWVIPSFNPQKTNFEGNAKLKNKVEAVDYIWQDVSASERFSMSLGHILITYIFSQGHRQR